MANGDSPELRCLGALREARAQFFKALIGHAEDHLTKEPTKLELEDVDALRSENTYQIAEFYYLLDEVGMADKAKIRLYLNRHNLDMKSLLDDKEKLRRQGLTRQRIQEALFQDWQIEKIVENLIEGKLRFDQSDLGRLMAPLMSAETCRKTVVALAKGGLLHRLRIGQVLVVSNGSLEGYYRQHLRALVSSIAGGG